MWTVNTDAFYALVAVFPTMATLDRIRVVRIQIIWMLAVVVLLVLFSAMSIPLFLSASLVGLVVLVEMATPRYARPSWVGGLRRFVIAGLIVFGLYVAVRMLQMIPPEAF